MKNLNKKDVSERIIMGTEYRSAVGYRNWDPTIL